MIFKKYENYTSKQVLQSGIYYTDKMSRKKNKAKADHLALIYLLVSENFWQICDCMLSYAHVGWDEHLS